jgi:SAM-dependent methyltransferase
MTDCQPREACALCAKPIKLILDLGQTAISNEIWDDPAKPQDAFPLRVGQCGSCQHVQLTDVISSERLFPPDYPYRSGTTETFRQYLKELAGKIAPGKEKVGLLYETAEPVIIDIGSNDGSLLKEFRALGYTKLLGLEPAAGAARDAIRDGIQTICQPLVPSEHGAADLVTALNVMAHTPDLALFAVGAFLALKPDGLFVFEVGYAPTQFQVGLDIAYHEHLSYHHLAPLVPFFLRYGMSLYDAELTPSQGGSARGYVKRGLHAMTPRLIELLRAEESFDAQSLLEKAAGKLFALGRRIESMTTKGPIGIYGAPAKLTTLLSAMAFDDPAHAVFRCVYDDNRLKVGRFTPGSHIPIVDSSDLEKEQPPFCLIASHNFANEIKKNHPGYRGEWVVP